ncbi:GH12963 [Drosophila grimshawi]|uniref:GH12963 n=1 Tax=Drosophila grimshawi TaxID=7222 RepID=B4K0D7_DROGR|nr:GH12963 [Drosophila grimshawi]
MDAQQDSSVDISGSASGRRRASDPNLFGRPSEAGVSCDEGAGPGARAASGRRPRRPLGRRVRLVREMRVVRVEKRRVLRRIAQKLRNRRSEIELLASPLHFPSDEEEGASPPHAPSIGEDAVGDAVPEADEEALPRRWLRWQYPELPPTPPRPDHAPASIRGSRPTQSNPTRPRRKARGRWTERSPCSYRQRTRRTLARSGGHQRLR